MNLADRIVDSPLITTVGIILFLIVLYIFARVILGFSNHTLEHGQGTVVCKRFVSDYSTKPPVFRPLNYQEGWLLDIEISDAKGSISVGKKIYDNITEGEPLNISFIRSLDPNIVYISYFKKIS